MQELNEKIKMIWKKNENYICKCNTKIIISKKTFKYKKYTKKLLTITICLTLIWNK